MIEISAERIHKDVHLVDNISSLNSLCQKIAVTPPYFALSNVCQSDNGYISANFPIDLKSHNEIDGISIAEAGRHMSILGALSLADKTHQDETHYYLATDAVIERFSNLPTETDYCHGEVRSILLDRKNGKCSGKLYSSSGSLIYSMEIKYSIIPRKLFERFYSKNYLETDKLFLGNPYAFPSRYCTDEINEMACSAFTGKVRKEDCIGHFPDFPALPIARIGGAMVDLSGFHYNAIKKTNKKFCIKRAELHANSLIFTNESVKYTTKVSPKSTEKEIIIESSANTGKQNDVVAMKCWFF